MSVNLIMAMSMDGFLCRGPDDDMSWTGPSDKRMFKALTLSQPRLYAGWNTARAMPSLLVGRELVVLPREEVACRFELTQAPDNSWLIGGPKTALRALRAGLVRLVYVNVVRETLKSGVSGYDLLDLVDKPFPLLRPTSHDLPGLWIYKAQTFKEPA